MLSLGSSSRIRWRSGRHGLRWDCDRRLLYLLEGRVLVLSFGPDTDDPDAERNAEHAKHIEPARHGSGHHVVAYCGTPYRRQPTEEPYNPTYCYEPVLPYCSHHFPPDAFRYPYRIPSSDDTAPTFISRPVSCKGWPLMIRMQSARRINTSMKMITSILPPSVSRPFSSPSKLIVAALLLTQ